MQTIPNCGVIGFGPVNQELCRILAENHWSTKWIARTSGLYSPSLEKVAELEAVFSKEFSRDLDAVFIGIPSSGDGATAVKFIRHFLRLGIRVITGEKASQACRPIKSHRYNKRLAYSATVGGNTDILGYISRDPFGVTEVTGVANTTLNFLRQRLVAGVTWDQAVAEAIALRFMESGDVQAELRDVLLKAVILFQELSKLEQPLRFPNLRPKKMSDELIKKLLAWNYSCLVKVSSMPESTPTDPNAKHFLVCSCRREKWRLEVYFENPLALPFSAPTGDNNVFLVRNQMGEEYTVIGQGAGVGPTAGQMFYDARELLGLN